MFYEKLNALEEELRKEMICSLDEGFEDGDPVNEVEFFNSLFAHFEEEDERGLKNAIQAATKFTVVVAPQGGGKTTLIRKTLRESEQNRTGFFLFDFKQEIEEFYAMGGTRDKKMLFIRDLFRNKLSLQFLKEFEDRSKFVWIALSKFFPDKFFERVQALRAKYEKTEIGKDIESLRRIYLEKPENADAVSLDHKYILSKITCAKMIIAIKETRGFEKFLIVLDNVDRLEVLEQPILFSVSIDIHHGGKYEGSKHFGTIVAVRDKNIMRYEEAGSNGNYVQVISILSKVKERSQPLRMSGPTERFVKELFEKRQEYALRSVFPDGFRLTTGDLKTKKLFEDLQGKVNQKFIEERFYNLANRSCREMLILALAFMRYLFKLASAEIIVDKNGDLKIDSPTLASYLYRWIYAKHDPNHHFLREIVDSYYKRGRGAIGDPLDCDLEIVLLAWLANQKGRRFLYVNQVLTSFQKIGVAPDKLLNTLHGLYDVDPECRYIELGECESYITAKELFNKNPRVLITFLGEEFVRNIMTKFEFLHQGLAHPDIVDSDELLVSVESNMESKVKRMLTFLELVKEVHLETLGHIKKALEQSTQDWLAYYREHFCINRKLVLERIVEQHLNHLEVVDRKKFSEQWLKQYRDFIENYQTAIKNI